MTASAMISPPAGFEIAAHPRGINKHAFGDGARVLSGAMRQNEALRQRERLSLPRSGCALLVVRPSHPASPARAPAPPGPPRVYIRTRSGCASAASWRSFRVPRHRVPRLPPTSVCDSRIMSVANLAEAAADQAEKTHRSGNPVARDVPRRWGSPRPSSAASPSSTSIAAAPSDASVPAAPPNCTCSTRGRSWSSRCDMGEQRLEPNGAFQPERDRECVLQMGAPGHHRVPVRLRLCGPARRLYRKARREEAKSLPDLEHHGRIHDVLGRRAPMGPAPRLARRAAQPLDHADHRIADIAHARRELVGFEMLDTRRRSDRLRRLGRDDAEPALHAGERRLDIQHSLQERALVEDGAHGVGAVQRAENRTVCGIDRHGVSQTCESDLDVRSVPLTASISLNVSLARRTAEFAAGMPA